MRLHQNIQLFRDAVRITAQQMNIPPEFVEKDYWVTYALFTIFNNEIGKDTVFKGGTALMKLIDTLRKESWADTTRFFLGGLSMGAMGTYELLHRMPHFFAAAFAICGGADLTIAKSFATDVPLWIFHGADDQVVSPSFSVNMAETIRNFGGQPRLNIYEGVGHDAWTPAFAEPGLFPWLFSHQRK